MSLGGQKQMRASGSHHSLMLPPREPPGPVVKQDAAEIESLKAQMSKMQMVINISVFLSFFTFIKSVG